MFFISDLLRRRFDSCVKLYCPGDISDRHFPSASRPGTKYKVLQGKHKTLREKQHKPNSNPKPKPKSQSQKRRHVLTNSIASHAPLLKLLPTSCLSPFPVQPNLTTTAATGDQPSLPHVDQVGRDASPLQLTGPGLFMKGGKSRANSGFIICKIDV